MNDSAFETLTVGKLTNNGGLTLDVNANTDSADQIAITGSGSNSVLTIAVLNLTAPTDTASGSDTYTYTKQILTGTTYTVAADLGTSSAGTYTLNGEKSGTSNTTVDLKTHSGFVLGNETTLVIRNIDLKDSTNADATLITVSNNDADITLTDSK